MYNDQEDAIAAKEFFEQDLGKLELVDVLGSRCCICELCQAAGHVGKPCTRAQSAGDRQKPGLFLQIDSGKSGM
jgi:hypothetical protein